MNAQRLLTHLAAHPDPDAILVHTGTAEWSTRQLLTAVGQQADRLAAASARVVASQYDNGSDWLIADLALQQIGAVHVPLPPFFSPGQVAHAVDAAGVDHWLGPNPPPDQHWLSQTAEAALWAHPQPRSVGLPHGCGLVSFTSSSTGQPKGVCLDRDTLFTLVDALIGATAPISPRSHLCALPLATLLEQVAGVYSALLSSARLALPGLDELGYSGASGLAAGRLLATLVRYQPESLIHSMWRCWSRAIKRSATKPSARTWPKST